MKNLKFAPDELFAKILEYCAVPTFDLVIWVPQKGIIIVKRKIVPYANKWALPGLRMMKPENIDDTLTRIATNEVGLSVNVTQKIIIGQFVGKFNTENNRQDISTGYAVVSNTDVVDINQNHFSNYRFINNIDEIPKNIGAMYRFYLNVFFNEEIKEKIPK